MTDTQPQTSSAPTQERDRVLDAIAGFAIFCVVAMHASGLSYKYRGLPGLSDWLRELDTPSLAFRFVVSIGVPLFVFLGGYRYRLRNYEQLPLGEYYKRRLPNLIKTFLIASFLYFYGLGVYLKYGVGAKIELKEFLAGFSWLYEIWLGKNRGYQLWYFPMYITVIASYPLFHRLVRSDMARLAMFGMLFGAFLFGVLPGTKPTVYLKYFIYFELGYCIAASEARRKWRLDHVTLILSLLAAATFALQAPKFGARHWVNALAIYPILLIPLLIGGFRALQSLNKKWIAPLVWLGTFSYPIFVFHDPIVLNATMRILAKSKLHITDTGILVMIVVPIVVSVLLLQVLRRLRLARLIF